MDLHTAPGRSPSTEQMAAVISLAAVTVAWVSGLAGMERSAAIWPYESPASTAGEKAAPSSANRLATSSSEKVFGLVP